MSESLLLLTDRRAPRYAPRRRGGGRRSPGPELIERLVPMPEDGETICRLTVKGSDAPRSRLRGLVSFMRGNTDRRVMTRACNVNLKLRPRHVDTLVVHANTGSPVTEADVTRTPSESSWT